MDRIEMSIKDINAINNFMIGKYTTNPNENDLAMCEFVLFVKRFEMNLIKVDADTTTIYRYDKENQRLYIKDTKKFYSKDKTHIELAYLEYYYENGEWIFDRAKFKVTFDGEEKDTYTKEYLEPIFLEKNNTKEVHRNDLPLQEFFYLNKFIMDYRPVITIEDKEEHIQIQSKKKHKKNKPTYRINLYKVIHLKKDWQTEIKKHIEYTCPAWRVHGHYRTYKSGKQVYIKPYVKGKNRNDSSMIVDKTYYMKGYAK
jgi:hypothetical protein